MASRVPLARSGRPARGGVLTCLPLGYSVCLTFEPDSLCETVRQAEEECGVVAGMVPAPGTTMGELS